MNVKKHNEARKVNGRNSFLHFIQYNNFFVIIVASVFVITGTTFAARPDVVVNRNEQIISVDNSYLLDINLRTFNPDPEIKAINSDADNYYIEYSIRNLVVDDYAWKDVKETKSLTVQKAALRGGDLGLYLAKQIGEVVDAELAYLTKVQKKERESGQTNKVAAVIYSGLVGKFFNKEQKTFPSYRPVVRDGSTVNPQGPLVEPSHIDESAASSPPILTEAQIQALIQSAIEKYLAEHSGNSNPDQNPPTHGGPTGDGPEVVPVDGQDPDQIPTDTIPVLETDTPLPVDESMDEQDTSSNGSTIHGSTSDPGSGGGNSPSETTGTGDLGAPTP